MPRDLPPDLKGAYAVLNRCYFHVLARHPKLSRADIVKVSSDYYVLYKFEMTYPSVNTLPIHVSPFPIEDYITTEAEVRAVLLRLKRYKAGGHTYLRVENFKVWLRKCYLYRETTPPNPARWDKLVTLAQNMWYHRNLPTDIS